MLQNYESNLFKKIKFFGEISNNWPNDLLELLQMYTRPLNFADNCYWLYYNVLILLQQFPNKENFQYSHF